MGGGAAHLASTMVEAFEDGETADDDDVGNADEESQAGENIIECSGCGLLADHEVLRERKRGNGADFLLKCCECGCVHTVQFRPPKIINIPIMLTEGAKSKIEKIAMEEDEFLSLEVIFAHDEKHWRLTRLENRKGKSVKRIVASDLSRATALRADRLQIKITMTEGEDSNADTIEVEAEKIFSAGSIIRHDGRKWRIRAIHTGTERTLTGKVPALEVKRLYLHEPPTFEEIEPRTGRERRQAWKEGRLGFNPNPVDLKKQPRGSGDSRGRGGDSSQRR
jgi:uncharacterized Zn finger protein